jgi:hypothetical protein
VDLDKTERASISISAINSETIGFVCTIYDFKYKKNGYGVVLSGLSKKPLMQAFSQLYSFTNEKETQISDKNREIAVKLSKPNWETIIQILHKQCQMLGQDWINWEKTISKHIRSAIDDTQQINIHNTTEEVDDDPSWMEDALRTSKELQEYYDDD